MHALDCSTTTLSAGKIDKHKPKENGVGGGGGGEREMLESIPFQQALGVHNRSLGLHAFKYLAKSSIH